MIFKKLNAMKILDLTSQMIVDVLESAEFKRMGIYIAYEINNI